MLESCTAISGTVNPSATTAATAASVAQDSATGKPLSEWLPSLAARRCSARWEAMIPSQMTIMVEPTMFSRNFSTSSAQK